MWFPLKLPALTRRRLQIAGAAFAMGVVIFVLVCELQGEPAVQAIIGAFALLGTILVGGSAG